MVDILLIEDNRELSQLMCRFLLKEGYTISCVSDARETCQFLQTEKARLVILDILLPGEDGFSICSRIREKDNVPIIFLSALVDKDTKMKGFLLGADDYVEKPVDIDLLSVKIAAIFKRSYHTADNSAIIHSGDIAINQDSMEVTVRDKKINLTSKEYDLLLLLVENKGKTLSKDYLFSRVWGADSFSENQTLTVHIKMLRDKIEREPKEPKCIITVWGTGYRYEEV